MSSIDKVKIGSTSYDVSPSKSGTLSGFTSNDASTPTAWTSSDVILATDTNSSIFAKLTTMIKNVRWLYAKLGDTDFSATGSATVSGAISNLQTSLSGKANTSHTHAVADLPVSSQQINSTAYIPTSSLLYSMQEQITSLNDALTEHIENGSDSDGGSGGSTVPDDYDANTENGYSSSANLYTLSSTADVDTFLTRFQRSNGYKDSTTGTTLKLGDQIAIKDGTYNVNWYVAGFDLEHNQTAIDGTMYDNGYGIALIPVTVLRSSVSCINGYYTSDYYYDQSGYSYCTPIYVQSTSTFTPPLQTILGDHLIQRNTLISSSTVSLGKSNKTTYYTTGAYTWINTLHLTLMSAFQTLGTSTTLCPMTSYSDYTIISKYDIGEANYKLPIFDNVQCYNSYPYLIRGWRSGYYEYKDDSDCYAGIAYINSSSGYTWATVTNNNNNGSGFRPMIYIR